MRNSGWKTGARTRAKAGTVALPALRGILITLAICVVTGCGGGGGGSASSSSNAASSSDSAPTLSSTSPTSASAGGAALTVTVNGTGFLKNSTVQWNGSALSTTYVSQTTLEAAIPAADIATTSTASITVSNPAPGGGTSSSSSFSVMATPVVAAGTLWVYRAGSYNWGGAWGDVTLDYTSTAVPSVSGTGDVAEMPSASQWEYWLPYPPVVPESAASQPPNSLAVGGNGIGFNTGGYNYITISIWPTQAGASASMGFYQASSTGVDIPIPGGGDIMPYGPSPMVVGQWNTYKIPLSTLGLPAGGQWIYKFIVQQQGTTPQVWYLDQIGFTVN